MTSKPARCHCTAMMLYGKAQMNYDSEPGELPVCRSPLQDKVNP
ncbi:hypothetical protein HNR32_000438 [Pectinatus brassicae]|uniref:Uncharacterized protein n=1 Tax=Pectinatus brassicae TaxID=862415 RepID=A0A840UKS8_9FIRM|nr:hypothetical protein [Pectinatus brassicae]